MDLVKAYLRHATQSKKLANRTTAPKHQRRIRKICDMWLEMAEQRLEELEEKMRTALGKKRRK